MVLVVKTPCFHCKGHRVQSLVGGLRFHMWPGVVKKKKKKKDEKEKKYHNKKLRGRGMCPAKYYTTMGKDENGYCPMPQGTKVNGVQIEEFELDPEDC